MIWDAGITHGAEDDTEFYPASAQDDEDHFSTATVTTTTTTMIATMIHSAP
jgi:hypothetical protein